MRQKPWPTWVHLGCGCLILAVLSMVANWPLHAELEGRAQVYSLVRRSLSQLLNAGSVWAALAVCAGWSMRRWPVAMLAGAAVAETTLVVHYGLGQVLGLYGDAVWRNNAYWFVLGVAFCAPLGLCGWLARRTGWLGLAARLVVPVGAVLEPWVVGMFSPPLVAPWSQRYATIACGVSLLVAGVMGCIVVLRPSKVWIRQ